MNWQRWFKFALGQRPWGRPRVLAGFLLLGCTGLGCTGLGGEGFLPAAIATSPAQDSLSQSQAVPATCPLDLATLADRLAHDLPAYANRVSQRSRLLPDLQPSTLLIASRPELEPLPLGGISGGSTLSLPPAIDATQQIFLTTLSRSSTLGKSVNLQQFHWLLLSRNEQGWWLVMSFSRTGGYPLTEPPTPPQESSQGVVAEAVRLWLRDCRAGALR